MTEPEKITTVRWRHPSCGKTYANRSRAREHAGRCWSDPANRACRTCEHYQPPDSDLDTGYSQDEGCGVGIPLPVIDRDHGPSTTLAVHCPAHQIRHGIPADPGGTQ